MTSRKRRKLTQAELRPGRYTWSFGTLHLCGRARPRGTARPRVWGEAYIFCP
jgi:hypothetical protein